MSKVVELEKFIDKKEPKRIFLYSVELEEIEDSKDFCQVIELTEGLKVLGEAKIEKISSIIEKCTLDIDKIIKEPEYKEMEINSPCDKTNCGHNFNRNCTFDSPRWHRYTNKCEDFWTIE